MEDTDARRKFLTFYDLVVGEVKVEQEEHVEERHCPTEEETRSLTDRPRQQSRYLTEDMQAR